MTKRDQTQPGEHIDPCRRAFLGNAMFGLGGIALQSLLSRSGVAGPLSDGGLFRDGLHHRPTAKRVIVIFCSGGLSQHDLFDPKPLLDQRWGEELPDSVRKEQRITGVTVRQGALPVAGTAFEFARHGESGMQISELLPHTAALADELCVGEVARRAAQRVERECEHRRLQVVRLHRCCRPASPAPHAAGTQSCDSAVVLLF